MHSKVSDKSQNAIQKQEIVNSNLALNCEPFYRPVFIQLRKIIAWGSCIFDGLRNISEYFLDSGM